MNLIRSARIYLASAVVASALFAGQAAAQEISESHMKAARAAVAAINATGDFDTILPRTALALKDQLLQQNPDLQDLIEQTVNEKAMAMAARRVDLEKEAASAYAKKFSEEDLNAIAAFYSSPAGQKLLTEGPGVSRAVIQAADIWQRGLARDLAQDVAKVLLEKAPKPPVAPTPDQPQPQPQPQTQPQN